MYFVCDRDDMGRVPVSATPRKRFHGTALDRGYTTM